MASSAQEFFSGTGRRAVPDPIAEVFQKAGIAAARYPARTGSNFITLAAGPPDDALLPTELYLELTAQALSAGVGRPSPLNYTLPQGSPPLRDAIADLLARHGARTDPADLLVTNGGMEALSIAAWLVLDPGDVVVTEGPGFAGALSMFELCGAEVVQLDCGQHGLDPDALGAAIAEHRPKLVFLMPDFQNPTGARMPAASRRRVGELLQDTGTYALEDGAYSFLSFDGDVLPPLQHFAPDHVFHATSLSKVFAPALRLGALVAPPALAARAAAAKSTFNMQASSIHQAVAERFLDPAGDHLRTRLTRVRAAHRRRRDLMLTALAAAFPPGSGFHWTEPAGGMFLWLSGPPEVDFTALLDRALDNGVAYVPGSKFYASGDARHDGARLNFASTPDDHIAEAVRRLARTVEGR